MGQKRIALLSYLQVTLLFVSLYVFKVAPLASLVMTGFFVWTLYRTFQPEDPGAAPRIIPVFRPHAPKGSQTFLRGFALARNFDRLEQLASEGKVPPLSTYGFACALHGEEMSWHAAGQAAPTVEHLLRTVQRKGEDEAELAQDLEALLGALSSADDQTEMALLLRCSNFTSALEWERIGGSPC